MKLWLGLKKHRAGGYGTPLSACVRLQVNLLMSILVQGAFSMDDMMAEMEVMMGTIDSMGGRGGCGSKITDKGLKMGSKGKRRSAKMPSIKGKTQASKHPAPAMAKAPPAPTASTGGRRKKVPT